MTKRKNTIKYCITRAAMTLLVMLLTTATAWADTGFNYIGADGSVHNTYTDNGIPDDDVIVINSSNKPTTVGAASTTTWCVVTEDVEYENSIEITGDVHFIIADGANMIIEDESYGINVSDDTSCLYIYGEDTGSSILTINNAEIGIRAKNVSIISGNVSINYNTRGISANNIDIYGGSVTFTDSDCSIFAQNDINIYGGNVSTNGSNGIYSKSGDITIEDGTIRATGTEYGICAEGDYYNGSYRGNITITGGTVTATSTAYYSPGIYAYKEVTITDGTVTATATGNRSNGIDANEVTIDGGTVTATGVDSGIDTGGHIIIKGGTIEATGGNDGIYSSDGEIIITGGTVTATGDDNGIYTNSSSEIIISGGKVTANGKYGISSFGHININGGDITATATVEADNAGGIWTSGGDIIITGGTVTATATGNKGNGLYSGLDYEEGGNIILSGGTIIANGNKSGIYAIKSTEGDGTITLNGGTVTANSYSGNVTVAEGLTYSDGTNNNIKGTVDTSTYGSETTLSVSSTKLTANEATVESSTYYWTTFYFGSTGFTIGNNACAYTATYGLNSETNEYELTLHKLGKNISQGTAVIIVSSSASVSMTSNSSLGTFSGSNSLRGVDVRTSTDNITSKLGSGTFYVMGKKENDFGFFKYTAAYMPARKAFLLIDGSNQALARGISMAFEDATGIKSIDKAQIGTESDAWYSLDGRKLLEKPTTRGLYINNGKKVVIK